MPEHHLGWWVRVLKCRKLRKRVVRQNVVPTDGRIAPEQKIALPLALKNPNLGARFVASAIIDGAPPRSGPLYDFELKAIWVTHKASIPTEGIFRSDDNRHRNDVKAVWQVRVHVVNCSGHGVCVYFREELAVENGTDFGIIDVGRKS